MSNLTDLIRSFTFRLGRLWKIRRRMGTVIRREAAAAEVEVEAEAESSATDVPVEMDTLLFIFRKHWRCCSSTYRRKRQRWNRILMFQVGSRILRWIRTPPISFECTSSRLRSVCEEDRTTGPSARSLIPARRLAGEIRGSITILVPRVRIFGRGTVIKEMRVSSLMEFSSAGFIRLDIGLSRARMERVAEGEFASLLIRRSSLGFCLSRVLGVRVPSLHTTDLLFGKQLRPVRNKCPIYLLQEHRRRYLLELSLRLNRRCLDHLIDRTRLVRSTKW